MLEAGLREVTCEWSRAGDHVHKVCLVPLYSRTALSSDIAGDVCPLTVPQSGEWRVEAVAFSIDPRHVPVSSVWLSVSRR